MEEKVKTLISEHFGVTVAEIEPSFELKKDLNATDLEIADFLQILEKTFSLTIPTEDASELATVEDITNYLFDHGEEVA